MRSSPLRLALALLAASLSAGLLAPRASSAPEPRVPLAIHIQKPLGGQTSERVVTIQGTVAGYAGARLTLVVNGIPMTVPVESGAFSQPQVLSPGPNAIRAVAYETLPSSLSGSNPAANGLVTIANSRASEDLTVTSTSISEPAGTVSVTAFRA